MHLIICKIVAVFLSPLQGQLHKHCISWLEHLPGMVGTQMNMLLTLLCFSLLNSQKISAKDLITVLCILCVWGASPANTVFAL